MQDRESGTAGPSLRDTEGVQAPRRGRGWALGIQQEETRGGCLRTGIFWPADTRLSDGDWVSGSSFVLQGFRVQMSRKGRYTEWLYCPYEQPENEGLLGPDLPSACT